MAKKKEEPQVVTASGFAKSILASMQKSTPGSKNYQVGDHFKFTYGVIIPHLIMQWLVGGSTVLPMQRIISVSGLPKSFKSTLAVEVGRWFVLAGGLYFDLDNEDKTSATMLDAMIWHCLTAEQVERASYSQTRSIEEWQTRVTDIIKAAKALPPRPKGERIPIFIGLDSLTGRAAEETQADLLKEGSAAARAFPVTVMQITNFLKNLDLTGLNVIFGYVRHAKPSLDPNLHGKPMEAGGHEASFRSSISLMAKRLKDIEGETHPALPDKTVSWSGVTVQLESAMSCLGPDKRKTNVNIIWQYLDHEFSDVVKDEDGEPIKDADGTIVVEKRFGQRQIMKYDWEGALGEHLYTEKYDAKKKAYEIDRDRLDKALEFTAPTTTTIKCKELDLDGVSFTEFGRAVEANPEVRKRISNYLGITQYKSVQDADIIDAPPEKAK